MDQKGQRSILWGSFYSYIVTGMAVLLPGAIMPYLLEEFNLGYDQGGLLLALKAIGNLAASILGGIVSDRIGRKPVLAFGALCFAISFAIDCKRCKKYMLPSAYSLFWLAFILIIYYSWNKNNTLSFLYFHILDCQK
jgi:MFS family permease